MMTPNMPAPSTKTQMEQILMTGWRKSPSGIMGWGGGDSAYRNATSIRAASASDTSTRAELQPCSVTHVSASSSGTTQPINVANPGQSSRLAAARGFMFGNSKYIAAIATAPTGRFTQKQARHDH